MGNHAHSVHEQTTQLSIHHSFYIISLLMSGQDFHHRFQLLRPAVLQTLILIVLNYFLAHHNLTHHYPNQMLNGFEVDLAKMKQLLAQH